MTDGGIKKVNGSLNNTVSRHPALVVAFISFLIVIVGTVTTSTVRMGYNHIMRRFDQIETYEDRNGIAHRKFDERLDNHEGRIIRIEATHEHEGN